MASWTDNNIPAFTPYRQQLPVNELVSVGMQKQGQYQQGIERIQSDIDRVAGMDVVRDIDRRYLQSKVNEIGNNTKVFAASDFSNFQLVNSLSGMVNQVSKDKNIINAVSSTSKYRKEVSRMEKAREDGKSSIANESYFGYKANDWLGSQDLNRGFDAQYREYIDVDKKWMEVFKSLHSDLAEQDIPWSTNPDGTINHGQTAAAMQRVSSEKVSSSKIENALRASLTPDELNQLNINGWYQFRDATPEQLAMQSKGKFDRSIQTNLDRIRELEGLANFTDDPQLKMNATNAISSLRSMNQSLAKDYKDELQFVQQNPDIAKGLIYKNGAIAQFAQAHAWEHSKTNLLTNPIQQAEFEQQRINLSRANLQLDQARFTHSKIMDDKNLKLREREVFAKEQEAFPDIPLNPFSSTLGIPTNIPAPLTAANDQINGLTDQATSLEQEILNKSGITKAQLDNAMKLYVNGDIDSQRKADSFVKGPVRNAVKNLIRINKEKNLITGSIEETRKEVMNSPQFKERTLEFNNEVEDLGGISFRTPDGGAVIFTPEEINEYLLKVKRQEITTTADGKKLKPVDGSSIISSFLGMPGGRNVSSTVETAIVSPLSEKEQILHNNRNTITQKLGQYQSAKQSYFNDVQLETQKKYAEKMISFAPKPFAVEIKNAEERQKWEGLGGVVALRYNDPFGGTRGGAEEVSPDDIKTFRSWMGEADKTTLQYQPIIIPANGKVYLNVVKGLEQVTIPLTNEEADQLPINMGLSRSPEYINLVTAQSRGKGSTNPTGKFEDAYFDRLDIPNTSLNIKADMEQEMNNPSVQYIHLYLKTPQGNIEMTLDEKYLRSSDGRYISPTNAMGFIRGLNDKQIVDLYMSNPDVSPAQKQIIQGLIQKQ